ncbi:toprim domain-containing protein [Spirosoma sp.]|uniref:CHC2 zinc finger domain-containing protein n=1 Tax=Spirosoma sp. TaxID=1899569 RepID=UPI0026220A5A|nr:toprim domain-containing protein [Spirosoma sp.]MCX6218303.1 CHC2 zinc finger domain-containing protein [Spirosoma sp.]
MKTKEHIKQLKAIPITHYLSEQGLQPVKANGAELVYYSPKNEEHTPSFFVNPQKNVFHDYSGVGEQGDIIRLIQYLNGCSFMQALDALEVIKPAKVQSFSFSGDNRSQAKKSSSMEIVNVQPLRNRALLDYVASRKIAQSIASTYLQEVYYHINQKQYYAAGFQNDKGGYELRSQYFKGGTSPKWFTYLPVQNSTEINLFEGVFDFLSCCQFFKTVRLKNSNLVLNSLTFIKEALPVLSGCLTINAFLDNDSAGKRALEYLTGIGLTVRDCSSYYLEYKDFNEYLVSNSML